MEHHFHVGAWSGELKSDALIVAIVVVAVVGYVAAATGRSASPAAKKRSRRNKPVPFRKIPQGNSIQLNKSGKVLLCLHPGLPRLMVYFISCQRVLHVARLHAYLDHLHAC